MESNQEFEECIDLTPEQRKLEDERLDGIVKKVEAEVAEIQEKRKNRSLPRKIFDSSYNFLKDNGDFLIYTSSGLSMTLFSVHGAMENMQKNPDIARDYAVLSLVMAFTTGVFFEKYRYRK